MEDGRFRKRQVKFYVTDDEYQTLKKKAKRNGMSVGKYIREMLIHASGRPVPTIDVAMPMSNYQMPLLTFATRPSGIMSIS